MSLIWCSDAALDDVSFSTVIPWTGCRSAETDPRLADSIHNAVYDGILRAHDKIIENLAHNTFFGRFSQASAIARQEKVKAVAITLVRDCALRKLTDATMDDLETFFQRMRPEFQQHRDEKQRDESQKRSKSLPEEEQQKIRSEFEAHRMICNALLEEKRLVLREKHRRYHVAKGSQSPSTPDPAHLSAHEQEIVSESDNVLLNRLSQVQQYLSIHMTMVRALESMPPLQHRSVANALWGFIGVVLTVVILLLQALAIKCHQLYELDHHRISRAYLRVKRCLFMVYDVFEKHLAPEEQTGPMLSNRAPVCEPDPGAAPGVSEDLPTSSQNSSS